MRIAELSFLVVEDHEFQRNVALKILADLGATSVAWAADGRAALKLLEAPAAAVDIIISDLAMPGMDGMEFMRHLGNAGIPVSIILASGSDGPLIASVETMTRAYGVTVLGAIEKPVTPAKLEALIRLHAPTQADLNRPEAARAPFTLEEMLAGLENDQFEPFFQPKVELASGRIRGAEALARWRHPHHGIIQPSAFIDTMERNDMIDALTWSMLHKAAVVCREWRTASGLDVTVSVNLSIRSLADAELAAQITELVLREDVEPRHMILELTESAATTDVGMALENLSRLRMNGFGLSIDDYGTGYSSMQQLMRIAFSEIKIDRAFVATAARHESARIILQSSLDMARKLNITSVAEGIESQQDWDLLHEFGCELAQGYFIAMPMEAGRFMEWAMQGVHAGGCTR